MKKVLFIILSIVVFAKATAQTGIGVIAPVNKFEVFAVKADPASSGATANGKVLSLAPFNHKLNIKQLSDTN